MFILLISENSLVCGVVMYLLKLFDIWQCCVDLGEIIQKKYNVDVDGEKQRAVDEALKEAEKRHSRELRAALKRLEKTLVEDKEHALSKQQQVTLSFVINYM